MTDFATVWDATAYAGDWQLLDADLATDQGLQTAVVLSLMTDCTLNDDDELPPDGDRGGWWGDLVLEGDPPGDRFGSRLRVLRRVMASENTRRRAVLICREALAWLVADGIARSVEVTAAYAGERLDQLNLQVTVLRRNGSSPRFEILWNATLASGA